ncbi:MAG TPA: GNAT family N-acetyltransferase [Armatimonadota bacterium]|nr:GNAT family N-acetyltransferase [Armatimonadota bacterium]HOS43350.1 GNAT family N-acetyltransferase [Armatimonadota bacterium]
MRIRQVTESDSDRWLDLRQQLWPTESRAELSEEMNRLLASDAEEVAFAAEDDDGTLVGLIEGSLRLHAPGCETSPVGYIEGWYVKPKYRRYGIGRILVERLEIWARERGCTEMASDTDSDYPISAVAHERLGYRETVRYRKGECRIEPGHDEVDYCIHFCKQLY